MSTQIAIVALNAYPAVNPNAGRRVGGTESFAWAFCRHLAAAPDWSVAMLIRHTARISNKMVDNVSLVPTVERLRNVRLSAAQRVEVIQEFPRLRIRQFHPKLLWQIPLLAGSRLFTRQSRDAQLERMLQDAAPDLVLTLGVNQDSAAAVTATRKQSRPLCAWLRSMGDLDPRFFNDTDFVDAYGVTSREARLVLEESDAVICQTAQQQQRLRAMTGRDSVVIPNPVDTSVFVAGTDTQSDRPFVLWIGRFHSHKRPDLALDVARRCPQIPFVMILNQGDSVVEARVRKNRPSNVEFREYIPRSEMPSLMRQSRFLLCTGSRDIEGFPNVLLEAAATGTPIASLDDFDGFLDRSLAGYKTSSTDELAEWLRETWDATQRWKQYSSAGINWVKHHHSWESTIADFTRVALSILKGRE